MNSPGNQFLARSTFSENQHAPICIRHQFELLAQRFHRDAVSDDLGSTGILPKPLQFQVSASLFYCVLENQTDSVDRERFFDEIESSELGGLYCSLNVPVSGNHDHCGTRIGRQILDSRQRLKSINARHPNIKEHSFIRLTRKLFEASLSRADRRALIIFVAQCTAKGLANTRLIVHDENFRSVYWHE